MDLFAIAFVVVCVVGFALLGGVGRSRHETRGRQLESAFYAESHRQVHTDATGVLMCRSCGASAPERAGRCPSCGAVL